MTVNVQCKRPRTMMMLSFLLGVLWCGEARAWYNTSGLGDCHHTQEWRDLDKRIENNELNFGPVIPTPPYSEGEFYTVLERNVSIQCSLPASLPAQAVVALTYNSSYMANMKTANRQTQSDCFSEEGERLEICPSPSRPADSKFRTCTIAVYDVKSRKLISPESSNLPGVCEEARLEHIDYPSQLLQSGGPLKIMIKQAGREQEGTYVCSILRNCRPAYNETVEEEEQEMVGVSKQVYLKVYEQKDYRKDFLVVSSVLGGTTILLVLTTLIQQQKSERVDHL